MWHVLRFICEIAVSRFWSVLVVVFSGMYLQVGDSGPRVICSGRLALLQLFKHQFAPLGLKQRSTFIKLQGRAGMQARCDHTCSRKSWLARTIITATNSTEPFRYQGLGGLRVSSDRPRLCVLGDHRWSMPLFFPASSVAHSDICHGHTTAYNAIFSYIFLDRGLT